MRDAQAAEAKRPRFEKFLLIADPEWIFAENRAACFRIGPAYFGATV
jgi:hypothetical protein